MTAQYGVSCRSKGSVSAWVVMWCAGCLLATAVHSGERCEALANNAFERLYCQVVSAGQGSGLPALEDFQRNEPRMQALLLQRPAQRLGLELPPLPDSASPSTGVFPEPDPEAKAPPAAQASKPEEALQESVEAISDLRDCRLQGEVIQCPQGRFKRVGNLPNPSLAPGVLDDDWQMGLPRFTGNPQDQEAVHRYLSQAYDVYISKMLSIGLAGNTMSFTEFVHGFRRHQAQGIDYSERLEATFQLLKQDKKNHAIPRHFHDRLPESLAACMEAGADIIVCDNVHTNWVYVRQ